MIRLINNVDRNETQEFWHPACICAALAMTWDVCMKMCLFLVQLFKTLQS